MQTVGLAGVRAVSAGDYHSVALMADGTARTWGVNISGEIGDGTTTERWVPTPVTGLTDIAAVDSGFSFTLALRADGTVATWGYNGQGQLGDGTTTNRTVPVTVSGLNSVVAVAAGLDHALALKIDGTVWAWGDNASGQLGDGTTIRRTTPVQVSGLTGVVSIDAGFAASLAIKNDGTVWTWGSNAFGELGDGTLTNRVTPVQMVGVTNAIAAAIRYRYAMVLKADNTVWTVGDNSEGQLGTPGGNRSLVGQVSGLPPIAYLGAGDVNGYAITAAGAAWAWGRNGWGNIGDGTNNVRTTPVQIAGAGLVWRPWIPTIGLVSGQYMAEQNPIISNEDASAFMHYTTTGVDPTENDPSVAAGATVAITQSATLRVRSFKAGAPPSEVASATYTLKVVAPSFSPSAGTYSSTQAVALSTTTGSSTIRYTLDGRTPTVYSSAYATPLNVTVPTTIKAFATRSGWTSSDLVSGTFWVSPTSTVAAPTISPGTGTYSTERVVTITPADGEATVRYTTDGTEPTDQSPLYVRAFLVSQTLTVKARSFKAGSNPSPVVQATLTIAVSGVSGAPSVSPVGGRFTTLQIVTVTGPSGATLRYTTNGADPTDADASIASGASVTIDRSMVLKVRAWQAGLAASVVRREDYLITGAISAGEAYSVALKADGTVWTWGDNYYGQLGDGGTAGRTSPVQILSGATAIAAGFRHALALKADGTVWGWGENYVGEVGDGTTTKRRSPVQVSGLTNVVAIAASFVNSYALRADGTVWAWGTNWAGQLGDGTTTDHLTPVKVPGLTGVQALAAGQGFVLALVSNGSATGDVWAWGYNNVGQLGDGTTTTRLMPQPVVGGSRIKAIFVGPAWAAARTANDDLLLWGADDNGQQANGFRSDGYNNYTNYFPTRAASWIAPLATISGGYYHVFATTNTAELWGWGDNWECELASSPCQNFRVTAELVPAFPTAASITGGGFHTLAIGLDGRLWSWGKNDAGQLGTGNLTWTATPTELTSLRLASNDFLAGDQDNDGLSTWREYQIGTDPLSSDTDGDGIPDSVDALSGDASTNLDPDGDGLSNAMELALSSDAYNADTDGDGVNDGGDAFPLDPSRTIAASSDPNDHTPPVITLTYPTNARPVGGGL